MLVLKYFLFAVPRNFFVELEEDKGKVCVVVNKQTKSALNNNENDMAAKHKKTR